LAIVPIDTGGVVREADVPDDGETKKEGCPSGQLPLFDFLQLPPEAVMIFDRKEHRNLLLQRYFVVTLPDQYVNIQLSSSFFATIPVYEHTKFWCA
jgi:hypothetical protein